MTKYAVYYNSSVYHALKESGDKTICNKCDIYYHSYTHIDKDGNRAGGQPGPEILDEKPKHLRLCRNCARVLNRRQ